MTRPVVIAHRGASAYLPEHTTEAKAAAHAMGADFIEQDIVASRDGVLLVLHDIYLEAVTDVAVQFPDRARNDGHFYVLDFDYAEIARLNVHERTVSAARPQAEVREQAEDSAAPTPAFPGRFPINRGRFGVSTLDEELDLIAGLNASTGRVAGIYPEIKDPAWHLEHGIDLTHLVLTALDDHGYMQATEPGTSPRVYLQCFDAGELQRIRRDIDPPLPLVQLLTGEDAMTPAALEAIAEYAQGIGPPWPALIETTAAGMTPGSVCANAQALGLAVHPYTFRRDRMPAFEDSFDALLRFFAVEVGIDGFFTDFPDVAVGVMNALDLN